MCGQFTVENTLILVYIDIKLFERIIKLTLSAFLNFLLSFIYRISALFWQIPIGSNFVPLVKPMNGHFLSSMMVFSNLLSNSSLKTLIYIHFILLSGFLLIWIGFRIIRVDSIQILVYFARFHIIIILFWF